LNPTEDCHVRTQVIEIRFHPEAPTDPTAARRSKVVTRLLEQKLLVEQGPQIRTVQRWSTKDGERVAVERNVLVG
jgi:hypothetical protein